MRLFLKQLDLKKEKETLIQLKRGNNYVLYN